MSALRRIKKKSNYTTNLHLYSSSDYELKARVVSKISKRIREKFEIYFANILSDCKEAFSYAK